MVLNIAEFLKKAEPIGSKGLGKIVGQIPFTLLSGEKRIGDIFEGNAVLMRYKDGDGFNVLVMNAAIAKNPETLLIERNKQQEFYTLFSIPVSEQKATQAYDSLDAVQ